MRRKLRFFLKLLFLKKVRRDSAHIIKEYNKAWADKITGNSDHGISKVVEALSDEIARYGIKSVLELGCGNGRVLVPLAKKNLNVKFGGVDISEEGIRQVKAMLPDAQFYHQDIRDMANLTAHQWDLVFTHVAIEQLPRDYMQVYQQAYRLSSHYAIFVEEYKELQSWLNRFYLYKYGYHCQSFKEVEKVGFKILKFYEFLARRKMKYKLGFLLCEKK